MSSLVIESPSFFVKLTGLDLTFKHLIALSGVTFVLLLLCLGIMQARHRRKKSRINAIPRRQMSLKRVSDVSERHKALILREIDNSIDSVLHAPVELSAVLQYYQRERLKRKSEFAAMMLESEPILERVAENIGVRRAADQSLEEFISRLQESVKALTAVTCDEYLDSMVNLKERKDDDEKSVLQFETFLLNFNEILKALKAENAKEKVAKEKKKAGKQKKEKAKKKKKTD